MEHSISKEMAKIAYEALDEKKAVDITIIDIQKVSVLADYFIIASGTNKNQVQISGCKLDFTGLRRCHCPCF